MLNNGKVNQKWCNNFNAWIEIWSLLEIKLSSRKFTWANNQDNLVMSTIDRIFCTTDIDSFFPLGSAQALPRLGSDHTPILWESGVGLTPKSSSYKFEKWWLLREEFRDLVVRSWSAPTKSTTAISIWQEKTRRFRKSSKGWSHNIEAALRKYKKEMMEEYDTLDIKSESTPLSLEDQTRMKQIHEEMQKIWLKEETKSKQRSRDRDIKEGDKNTAYFHAVANQRRRKTLIHTLDGPDGPVTSTVEMLDVATSFYKDLFCLEDRTGFTLSPTFFLLMRKSLT